MFNFCALTRNETKCPMCLEPCVDPIVHSCGNMFCAACLNSCVECPLCRSGRFLLLPIFQDLPFANSVAYTKPPHQNIKAKLNALLVRFQSFLTLKLQVICPNCFAHVERGTLSQHSMKCPTG